MKAWKTCIGSPNTGPARRSIMLVLAASMVLPGCSTLDAVGRGALGMSADSKTPVARLASQKGPEIYRGKYSFVRLAPSETGAAASQSRAIDAGQLAAALSALTLRNGQPVFVAEELDEIVPHLSYGLEQAKANEDVVFAVSGTHGSRLMSSHLVTTGRMFVTDGQLNLIFGLLQSAFDVERLSHQPTKVFTPGSRLRVAAEPATAAGGAWLPSASGRSDWLVLPLDRLAATVPAAVPSETAAEAPPRAAPTAVDNGQAVSDVERRLAINAHLLRQGLVTEEEYQEKRRAILKDF